MKRILTVMVAALCCIAQPALAQDAKAKTILDAMSKKVSALKTLKASFSLKLTSGRMNDTKTGSFSMKGKKYHVNLNGQEIICDGRTVWTYNKDANEVQISNYNPSEQTISPDKLFTNFYDKEYKYRYAGARTVNGKQCDVIELTPNNKSQQFSKIELAIDKKSGLLAGGFIWEKSGTQYQYMVSNLTTNANIPDAAFSFNTKAHPGVEVVDLR
jgi:outer membrane lipoprotein carrier protein